MTEQETIINKIVSYLEDGQERETTREIICMEYGISHNAFVHPYVMARAKMRKDGE